MFTATVFSRPQSSADVKLSVTTENVDCFDTSIICRKSLLLNIERSFILFDDDSGKPVRIDYNVFFRFVLMSWPLAAEALVMGAGQTALGFLLQKFLNEVYAISCILVYLNELLKIYVYIHVITWFNNYFWEHDIMPRPHHPNLPTPPLVNNYWH